MNYKYKISIVEGILFVLLIVFTVLTIFDLLMYASLSQGAVFGLWTLRLTIILFILFLILPNMMILFKKIGEKTMLRYNQQRFKRNFFENIKGMQEINIMNLANKFDVKIIYIKNFLRNQITQGYLRGELVGDIFRIKEEYKVLDSKEKTTDFFKENLERFLAPYRMIKIKEITRYFKLPKKYVKMYMSNQINEEILKGFFDGDTFIRSSTLTSEEVNCPHCNKNINLKEL